MSFLIHLFIWKMFIAHLPCISDTVVSPVLLPVKPRKLSLLSQSLQVSERDSHSAINYILCYLISVCCFLFFNFSFDSSKNEKAYSSIKAYGSRDGEKLTHRVSIECFLEREKKYPGPKGWVEGSQELG